MTTTEHSHLNGGTMPDFLHGRINFGTPERPNTEAKNIPLGRSTSAVDPVFETQVLERLSKIQRQQATDMETILNLVDARSAQMTNRLTSLEKKVAGLSTETASEEYPAVPEAITPVASDALHPSLADFSLESLVRMTILAKLHGKRSDRSKIELKPANLRNYEVRDQFAKLTTEQQLGLIEDYVKLFLKTRKLKSSALARKYPQVDFKLIGNTFSHISRALNKAVSAALLD